MLTLLPRLSLLLTLALAACTSTADDPVVDTSTPTAPAYDVTIAVAPLTACADPAVTAAVDLRGAPRLLLQISTTPVIYVRPPLVCTTVSGACGHFRVLLTTRDTLQTTDPIEIVTASTIVEVPLETFGAYTLQVFLVGDDGATVLDLAGQPVATPEIPLDVLAPDDLACQPPV